ncbi:MAG TPA: hypothetical protein VG756_20315 [Pseudonocardiaceae bacterium]|jgi:hypothetical protein|nr:hypothetical protein [Pseudonocardiaceae bacterium]
MIGDDYGPKHAGSGDMHNTTNYYIGVEERLRRGSRNPRRTAREHLVRLNRQFVEPPGYSMAQATLETSGCVLLVGASGIGKRAAGQVLLHRVGGQEAVVQDESGVPPDNEKDEENDEDEVLVSAQVPDDGLVLLDPAEDRLVQVMKGLSSYQTQIWERNAYLAVVLTESEAILVPEEMRHLLVTLRRPDPARVVRRHLEVAEISYTDQEIRDRPALRDHQATDPMRNLAELVRLISAARDQLGGTTGFSGWLDAALDALGELGNEVAAKVKSLSTGEHRALLLATAMLIGASADQVDLAATALARATAQPETDQPPLERDDLFQRMKELNVTVDRDRCVRFAKFGYERAVRQYFWDNFVALRGDFRDWARDAAVSLDIGAPVRARFVSCFADQALRTGRPDDIADLVSTWVRQNDRSRALPAAGLALQRGLGDQRYGARFRRLIYDWSCDSNTGADAAHLSITMCATVIASTHPAEAVVRLHHFIRRQGEVVRDRATDALFDLVRQDRREFRHLVERIATGLTHKNWDADFALFLTLARPRELTASRIGPLLAETFVRQRLADGWRAVLSRRRPEDWGELAREWLNAAEAFPRNGLWVDTLIAACAEPGPGAGNLYGVVGDWAREPGVDLRIRKSVAVNVINRMVSAAGGR